MREFQIRNVIASSKIHGRIDLEKMSDYFDGVTYEPEIFQGLIFRNNEEKFTIVMFSSGTVTSSGTKTIPRSKQVIINTIKELAQNDCIIGSSSFMRSPSVNNIVATMDVKVRINLDKILHIFPNAKKPSNFPSVNVKPFNDQITCLFFESGKINIVGAKTIQQLEKTRDLIIEKMNNYS